MRSQRKQIRDQRKSTRTRGRALVPKRRGYPFRKGRKGRRSIPGNPKRILTTYPAYLTGVPRKPEWPRRKALRKIHGMGRFQSDQVRKAAGVPLFLRVGKRKPYQIQLMEAWVSENRRVGPDRRRREDNQIQRHRKLGTVRGMKMRRGLPVRGQRTSTNGQTARRLNKHRGRKPR